jgi:hypothetical protein
MARAESGFSLLTAVGLRSAASTSSPIGKMNTPPSASARTAWVREPALASAAEASQMAPETNGPMAPST